MVRTAALLFLFAFIASTLAAKYSHKDKGENAKPTPILHTPVEADDANTDIFDIYSILAYGFGAGQIEGGIGIGGMGGSYGSNGGSGGNFTF
ncbi:hypothetical protein HF086_013202 [Spodoptera exigua]|uniref:Uncharacterized protein n=1 Tax=Spodoptera exigua TaxID=7107 RepID=A0A922MBX3_SPOEX|nr:hypothetical protein HF086_013202 [Spodoptera exigua]